MNSYDLDNFEPAAKIVVIGVGGAGNNAVNRMIDEEINNVEFYVANTDKQALATSKANNRIILGQEITGGLGAGGEPEIGEKAAEASAEDIKEIVKGANMVFVAAGMGGGTGTGAAPIIAKIAKDAGALVVGIVTRPFTFEGKKRTANAIDGLNKLKDAVDSIIVVNNDKLLTMYGGLDISEAFNKSDNVLAQSVKTVVNLILLPAVINLDFADVRNTLKGSGVALIGFGMGSGPNRAKDAAADALNCPLLEVPINGARRAIIAVTCGRKVSLYEAKETVDLIFDVVESEVDIKFGVTINNELDDEILVSVIASDFSTEIDFSKTSEPVTPIIKQPRFEEIKEEIKEDKPKTDNEVAINEDDFLPDFLKN